MIARRLALLGIPLLALSASVAIGMSAAASSILVVDASGGPGANFTALQPAIDAAAPGDLLLVKPGSYGDFTMTKPLRILGEEGVRVEDGVVQGVDELTILADLEFSDLLVQNSTGTVVLDGLLGWGPGSTPRARILVDGCDDVRMIELARFTGHTNGSYDGQEPQVVVRASRVEITLSELEGKEGKSTSQAYGYAGGGEHAVVVEEDGFVHVSRSNAAGGRGGNATNLIGGYGGEGGNAVEIVAGEALITGRGAELFAGGRGGGIVLYGYAGNGGDGIHVSGAGTLRYSGVKLKRGRPGGYNAGFGSKLTAAPAAVVKQPKFDDPSLDRVGEAVPGGTLTLKLRSKPGTFSRLFWGTQPTVNPTAGVIVENLVVKEQTIPIGIVPSTGVLSTQFQIDPSFQPGETVFLQAMSIFPNGKIRRTNSVPVVVR